MATTFVTTTQRQTRTMVLTLTASVTPSFSATALLSLNAAADLKPIFGLDENGGNATWLVFTFAIAAVLFGL
jgi:hypothetical protein